MTAKPSFSKFPLSSRRGAQERLVSRRAARSSSSWSRRNPPEQRACGRCLREQLSRMPYAFVLTALAILIAPYAVFSAIGGLSGHSSWAGTVEGGLREQDADAKQIVPTARPPLPVTAPGKQLQTSTPRIDLEVVETVGTAARQCKRSSLWGKHVDASSYDLGCEEIEEMLRAKKVLIGSGNIRDVYLTEFKGQKVVAKVLREDFEIRASKARARNIHRWEATALDSVRGHPNIVGTLGMCGTTSVSKYFAHRLDDLILKQRKEPLPISRVLSMSLDAARGLQALHEAPGGAIVHYDIKPHQMMLDDDGTLMINDLNMCWFADIDETGASCPVRSPASNPGPWRSPENIAGEALTEKLDVYSLAMVFYAMLANKPPFMDLPDAHSRIRAGFPPDTDSSWHPGFVEIMQDMWRRDPETRLSAKQVVARLKFLIENLDNQWLSDDHDTARL